MTATGKNVTTLSIGLLSACFIILNIIRVCHVPVTYDEAWTYKDFVSGSYADIVGFIPLLANNHPVNSLLTKFFVSLFGSGVIVLRLANILAQVVFLFYSGLLVSRFFKGYRWAVAAFLLLNLNPFVFDFWGLSRGYGLSLAFMMASVCYLLRYISVYKRICLHLSLAFGLLSVYANFSLLNFYIAVVGVACLYSLGSLRKKPLIVFIDVITISAYTFILYRLIAEPVVRLKEANELYFGRSDGIINGTFYSLVKESLFLYDDQRTKILAIAYGAAALIALTGLYWIITWWRNKDKKAATIGLAAWLLLVIPLLSTELQYRLLGNLYLIERTALFLYPLFILQLTYCLYHLHARYKWPVQLAAILLMVTFSANFIKNINFRFARSWQIDQYNTMVLDRMKKNKTGHKLKIRVSWQFRSSLDYYVSTSYAVHFYPLESRWSDPLPGGVYDYYYLTSDDKNIVPRGYAVDTLVESGKYILYKKLATDR